MVVWYRIVKSIVSKCVRPPILDEDPHIVFVEVYNTSALPRDSWQLAALLPADITCETGFICRFLKQNFRDFLIVNWFCCCSCHSGK